MLIHTDLKRGVEFILEKQPYEVLESDLVFKGRGRSVVQAKIKNLITGNVISRSFHVGENFEEAQILKKELKFLYSHKDNFVFCEKDNGSQRTNLTKQQIGESVNFLKPNEIVQGIVFEDRIINVLLPIKTTLKVIESPPGVRGDRSEGGTKLVTLETGAQVNVPLFIEEGDIIEINTQTGEYVKRI